MGQAIRPPHIALVVEDDRDLRALAATVLEETSLDVVEADSAEEALHYLRNEAESVALLFTDIRLPALMDGVDLAKAVSRAYPWIEVIVTSGDPGDRLDDLPREARYLPKPWRVLDMLVAAEKASSPRH